VRGRDVGSTFSDLWYRVADATPRLSAHARVTRQRYGPTMAYIVEDPASGQFFRMSESAHFLLGMLDGRTTVDQAWQACNEQLGDAAPTQREVVELLSRLQMFGLVTSGSALDAELLERRLSRARKQRLQRRTGRWMFPHVPLINPEPFLARHERLCRLLFSPAAGVAWLVLVGVALWLVFLNADRFAGSLADVARLDPATLATLGAAFLGLRAVHELGHAVACKAMGGRSTEIGVILIAYVLPLPYCDATSAWRFARIWPRVLVSLGGVLAESVFAAAAAIVWATGSDATMTAVAYQIMLVSGVSTLVFNLNPLLRYDGYYILSDLAGAPNLTQRSRQMLLYLLHRYVFGVRGARAPAWRSTGEAWLLVVYGLLSTPYRVFVGVAILLLIADSYLTLGVALAAVMAVVWLVWPVLKAAGFLLSDPKLEGRRSRALGATLAALAALLGPILAIPLPTPAYAAATVEPARLASARALEGGELVRLHALPGDAVEAGQLIATLRSDELIARARALEARIAQAELDMRRALGAGERPAPGAPPAAAERERALQALAVLRERRERVRRRIADLELRAPVAGRLAPPAGQTAADVLARVGAFVPRGTALGMIVSEDDLVVRALVPDRDHAFVFGGRGAGGPAADGSGVRARVRLASRPGDTLEADVLSIAPSATRRLPSEALSTQAGGSVPTEPRGRDGGAVAARPSFLVDLRLRGPVHPQPTPGVRASVRLSGPSLPLGLRWLRRAGQFFEGRSWL